MGDILFISDLHLDPSRPRVTAAFEFFLSAHAGQCSALYILGDLFESWIGDDDDSAFAQRCCAALAGFSNSGSALHIMRGNRDFLLGGEFASTTGATLIEDPTPLELAGQPTLLQHGDSLCTRDADYQAFRRVARDPRWQAELLAHPLTERRQIAAQLREQSAEATSNKAEDIMDVTPSAVDNIMMEYEVTCLIHGHTHRPATHKTLSGVRWVLGDWDQQGWFIRAGDSRLSLSSFYI